jgi:hypothetical protein
MTPPLIIVDILSIQFHNQPITISALDHQVLLRHISMMRDNLRRDNDNNGFKEGDQDYRAPESWMLSDSLEMAATDGGYVLGEGAPELERIRRGIQAMARDGELKRFEPYGDADDKEYRPTSKRGIHSKITEIDR